MAEMTISTSSETAGVSTATRSQILRLNPGRNRVWVWSDSWDGSKTAALMYSPKNDDAAIGPAKDSNGAIELTENDGADLFGPGFVCFDLTAPDGDAVYMSVSQCNLL